MGAIFASEIKDRRIPNLLAGVTWSMLEAQAAVERRLMEDRLTEPTSDTPFSFYWLERFGEKTDR